ncbi:hypothetical protein FIBSPDRAFT_953021 [Athelia psychrophila]|uniref:Uncharacterized protein n=1 Tax=Athelia psychrophila TaxID=1759441 RepID=A0A166KQL1_9AGAM|nr:hypothetical protein FIBSPDRAFT_953021 [Fibularhizoctonia sp. CBS 109695]
MLAEIQGGGTETNPDLLDEMGRLPFKSTVNVPESTCHINVASGDAPEELGREGPDDELREGVGGDGGGVHTRTYPARNKPTHIQPVRSSSRHASQRAPTSSPMHGHSPQVRTLSLCTHPARPHVHANTPAAPRLQSRTQPRHTSPPMLPSHVPRPTTSHLTTYVAQPRPTPNQARNHSLCPHPSSHASALPAPVSSPHPIPMRAQSAPSPHTRTPAPCLTVRVHLAHIPELGREWVELLAHNRKVDPRLTARWRCSSWKARVAAVAKKKAKGGHSNTIPGLELLSLERKPPKMHVRSLMGPSHVTFAEPTKVKEYIWCKGVVEDGWQIQTDAGGGTVCGVTYRRLVPPQASLVRVSWVPRGARRVLGSGRQNDV